MLVLKRKTGQVLHIDGPCKIHVVSASARGEIKLGIEAERTVQVLRGEAKVREKKSA